MHKACLVLCLTPCLLAACQQADARPQAANEIAQGAPLASTMIAGEYRVAAIDGEEVADDIGIALTITDRTIWFEPRCAGFSWTYVLDGRTLAIDRPQKARKIGDPYTVTIARPVCRIAVHPEKRRLAGALDAVSELDRLPSNALELNGDGHSVTLFRQ